MECSFCHQTFSTKSNLTNHQKTARKCLRLQGSETHMTYQCTSCPYTTSRNPCLLQHQRTCVAYLLHQKEKEVETKLKNTKSKVLHEYEVEIKLLQKDLSYKQQEIDRLTAQLEGVNARYQRLAEMKPTGPMTKAEKYAYLQPLELASEAMLVFPTHAANLKIDTIQGFTEEFIRMCLTAPDGTIQLALTDRSRGMCTYRNVVTGKLAPIDLTDFGQYFDMGPYFLWAGNTSRSAISDSNQHKRLKSICDIYTNKDTGLRMFVNSMKKLLVSKALSR
jgi:hypothetical protein